MRLLVALLQICPCFSFLSRLLLFQTNPTFPVSMSTSSAAIVDLVLDFLESKGYDSAAEALRTEIKEKIDKSSTSQLETLLRDVQYDEPQTKKARLNVAAAESSNTERQFSVETRLISYNPCDKDPYGAAIMPIYQTATFAQPEATVFGDYDYTRSGNPTRDALQKQLAELEGVPGARCFCFTTGMAALAAVTRLVQCGEEVIVNDDSYGGTYRLMSKVATRHGIKVTYINMAGPDGAKELKQAISSITKLVMIESPTNPMQRICDVRSLAKVCHENTHPTGTLLSVDNTMMSPILSRPLEQGADIVMHSATKFMCGHSDTMAGAVIVADKQEGDKSLGDAVYFFQNAEGTGLAPFDCWLVSRGLKTMALRVERQQYNAIRIARWLKAQAKISVVYYAGLPDHPDSDIHRSQSTGGGAVVCFCTGDTELSKHIVTHTKLFKITVSFGSVTSLISLPGLMSHASIPADVRSAREFPEDLVRMSIGIEDVDDLIFDLERAISSYTQPAKSS